jgi:hypothetical protein
MPAIDPLTDQQQRCPQEARHVAERQLGQLSRRWPTFIHKKQEAHDLQ